MSRILLDTHAFLWFANGDSRLSASARERIESPSNDCLLSVASVWEIAIKASMRRLDLDRPLGELLRLAEEDHAMTIYPVQARHAVAVQELPFHHRDPFD